MKVSKIYLLLLLDSPLPVRFFNDGFIEGLQSNHCMSVVRRFFCLFVTFDLIFVSLLWLICTVINGDNIYKALENQIINYTIETSLFDVVITAAARFLILILFYAILHIDHWIIVALTTSLSCGFLITKVFYYEWPINQQPFQVLLIIISFVLSWFEAWFLDSRMIPQELYSRTLAQGKVIFHHNTNIHILKLFFKYSNRIIVKLLLCLLHFCIPFTKETLFKTLKVSAKVFILLLKASVTVMMR